MLHALLALAIGGTAHTGLHPAGADLYAEVPDLGAAIAVYQHAPAFEITSSMGATHIADVARDAGFDLRALVLSILPVPDPDRAEDRWWPWSQAQRASWSFWGIEQGAPTADRGALFICDFKDEAAAAQAERALIAMGEREPKPLGQHTLGGKSVTLQSIGSPQEWIGSTAWCANAGTRLALGIGNARAEDLAERSLTNGGGLSAKWSEFQLASTGTEGVVVLDVYSDLDDAPSFLGDSGVLAAATLTIAPYTSSRGRWRVELRADRFYTDGLFEPRGGAAKMFEALGTTPASSDAQKFVPPESVGAWIGSIDPRHAESMLRQWLSANSKAIDDAAQEGTQSPRLSDGLGSAMAVSLMPIQSLISPAPRVVLAVELTDGAKFQAGLEAYLVRAQSAEPDLQVERKPYRKVPTIVLSSKKDGDKQSGAGGMPFGGAGLEPTRVTIAVLDDRVIVASAPSVARNEIKRLQDKSDVQPNALLQRVAHPVDAFEFSTIDWGAFLATIYDGARGLLPALAQGREQPLQLDKLPTGAELLAPLRPSTSWSKRLEGRIQVHSESSLGPETPLAIAALFSVGTKAMRAPPTPSPVATDTTREQAPDSDPDAADSEQVRTLTALREVRTAIAVYRSQVGRVPATTADLLQKTEAFPDGFLKSGAVPKDAWGHELVYMPVPEGTAYTLHSMGADGIDQAGSGDDVRLP